MARIFCKADATWIQKVHWAADAGDLHQKEAESEAPLPHARPHDMTEVP